MATDYDLLVKQTAALIEDAGWEPAALANISALLMDALDRINWVGFYIMDGSLLRLGPFQGKVACTVIEDGKGVCGAASSSGETQLVYDVHQFPGHIACDAASNSEIVIPLFRDGKVWGVLDIDSPFVGRFTEEDKKGLERIASTIETGLEKLCNLGEQDQCLTAII